MAEGLARALERPLPRPRRDLLGYASARALEALLEALLALEFLERGYSRNAAGKAYLAWRALTGALLALEKDRLLEAVETGEERRWLQEKAVPRVPSSRMKPLSQLLEEATGLQGFSAYTDKALDLHDYQYHGPDPDLELSKYRSPREAAYDVKKLLEELARLTEEKVKPRLEEAGKWSKEHDTALRMLQRRLSHTS